MRRLPARVTLVAIVLSSVAMWASNPVEILEVGLKGYYSARTTAAVRSRLMVPSGTQSLQLQFVAISGSPNRFQPLREDHFSQVVSVTPGESIEIESPLMLSKAEKSKLELTVLDSSGQLVGKSSVAVDSLARFDGEVLFALLCRDRMVCDEMQSQISFSGSSDDAAEKNKRFKFVALDQPREHWWDYSPASFVVVADPVSSWTPQQRGALELYLREGGRVIVLDKESNDASFLEPYRQTGQQAGPVLVGRGGLWTVPDLVGKTLGAVFQGESLKNMFNGGNPFQLLGQDLESTLRGRVAVSFTFPRLRWILLCLAIYILVVGVANFAVLRRLGKMEWGWISTASIAVLFAFGFYLVGSAKRPKEVTLDEIPIYWMDSRSAIAAETVGLRISSPRLEDMTLTAAGEALLVPQTAYRRDQPNVQIATSITQTQQIDPGLTASLGPPLRVDLSLLRWSFRDVDLVSSHIFPGTIRLEGGRLKNGTGQHFREAEYLDFKGNLEYSIPAVEPNQEIELPSLTNHSIWLDQKELQVWDPKAASHSDAISLYNLNLVPYLRGRAQHVFVGISDGPAPEVALSEQNFTRHNFIVTVISMDQP